MEPCYELCNRICLEIMRALEIGLHLTADSLTERCTPRASDLRLNHYPAVGVKEMKQGRITRISPHTDFGIISLLLQDNVGGLEIEDRVHPASFIPVLPRSSGEMIINISDTLQRWTNDNLQAGVHQVTIPYHTKTDRVVMLPERFSMAYFFKAAREVPVGPLPMFVNSQQPTKYRSMTALEFQQWRNQM
ncbi:MAG: hypothetical protein Q9187_000746, partial [Circinaria calcarea]